MYMAAWPLLVAVNKGYYYDYYYSRHNPKWHDGGSLIALTHTHIVTRR